MFFCGLSAKIEDERTGSCASRREEAMDKKQKRKIGLAAAFVIVCGAGSLGAYYGRQPKERLVFQRQEQLGGTQESFRAAEEPSDTSGETGEADTAFTGEKELCVYVCGAVAAEGVYFFQEGSRVIDAVKAAGGFTDGADSTYHNLAACLADGQKIYVPTAEETKELTAAERMNGAKETEGGIQTAQFPVNINTAGKELLMTLAGIGETKAESILAYRQKFGRFQTIEDLKNVNGIGEALLERIKDNIVVK